MIEKGKKVRVISDEGTLGMLISEKNLNFRGINKEGIVMGCVPGHGGDVLWVEHSDGIAAYCYTELEII